MNTTEIEFKNQIKSFKELFDLAYVQFINYEKIEGIPNWKKFDFSIDCSEDQFKFKDMMQIRFIEELTEASQAINETEHFWEEIGDSLNFFLSGYLMLNRNLNEFSSPEFYLYKGKKNKTKCKNLKEFSLLFYPIIEKVGNLCNLLKNRPWAQSNYLVSMIDFNERLDELWIAYWKALSKLKLKKEDVFEIFYKKLKVNEFRINTGY